MKISNVGYDLQPSKSKQTAKKAVIATAAAAATLGTIALLAKQGKFDSVQITSESKPIVDKTKNVLKTIGDSVCDTCSKAKNFVADKSAPVLDKIESKINPAKFNPDLAGSALKSAETFNGFNKAAEAVNNVI